jgi:outer membrane biogenesis lipoprotein LolB
MRRATIAVLATVVMLAGCTPRSPAPSAPAGAATGLPTAQQIFAALAHRREAIRSLRALARLSYASPEESRKAKQLVVAERPDRLRFEILSPFGTVFVLTAADGSLAAWVRSESTVYRGTASPENLQRYVQVDLPVTTAVDILLATPPLHSDVESVVSNDGAAIELWQDGGDTVQVAWLTPTLEPLRYEQRADDGQVLLRATFGEYATIDGQRVPTQLGIELPPSQRRIEIALSETEVNPPLADAVFALETPAGSKVVDMDDAE